MMRKRGLVVIGVLSLFFAAASPASVAIAASGDPDHSKSRVSVYATGLDAPRGLAFGPHGVLYVAEAGTGGTTTSVDACPELQVPAPLGPVMNGPTARISKISRSGVRSTVVDGLPSSVTQLGGDEVGVADVAIVDGRLYAIIAGGGCSNGLADKAFPNGVIRVNRDESWSYLVDLSSYYMTHPVTNPEPEDFTADGVPYDMVTKGRDLYILEANSGALDQVSTRTGSISRVIDISATQGHIVPTALDRQGKNFYVGNLGTFPITPGAENIYRISPNGRLKTVASGLTAILGVAFDDDQRMYVLETSTTGPFPNPGAGQIVRQSRSGSWETVVSGLTYPSAMIFGPDEALYVSTNGYNNTAAGEGQVVRVDVDHHH